MYLTLLGFQFPIRQAYDTKADRKKAWVRELMHRIIKSHGPNQRFEYRDWSPIEQETIQFLQRRFPNECKFTLQQSERFFDIYQFKKTKHRENRDFFAPLKDVSGTSIESMLGGSKKIIFECLFMPKPDGTGEVTSRHVMLCISGFLSESGAHTRSGSGAHRIHGRTWPGVRAT